MATVSNENKFSKEEAIEIAQVSDNCLEAGKINSDKEANYNPNSKTWWIGIDSDKQGCNPACVVAEDKTSEINWRCTGLIP